MSEKKKKVIDYEDIEKSAGGLFDAIEGKSKKQLDVKKIKANKKIEASVKKIVGKWLKVDQSSKEKRPRRKRKKEEEAESGEGYYWKSDEKDVGEKPTVMEGGEEGVRRHEVRGEYQVLLTRFYEQIKSRHPKAGEDQSRIKIKPPQIGREPRKTILMNYEEICESLHRQQEHLKTYLLSELETQGSFDSNRRLVIRGIFYQKDIEQVLKKYIEKYLQCKDCRGFKTTLTRDASTRLYNLVCQKCGATRTVTSVLQRRRRV